MTLATLIFVLLGVLLVVVLTLLARSSSEDSAAAIPDHLAVPSSSSRDAAVPLLSRIFSASDLQYVQRQNNPHVLRLFRLERKRVALLFLSDLRARTREMKALHARAALVAHAPDPSVEVRIALGYFSILLLATALSLLVRFFGITAIRVLAAPASALSDQLSNLARVSESARNMAENSASR